MSIQQVFLSVGQNIEQGLEKPHTFESLITTNMFLALLPLTLIAASVLLYQRRIAESGARVNLGK
jgi:hypothetical protein